MLQEAAPLRKQRVPGGTAGLSGTDAGKMLPTPAGRGHSSTPAECAADDAFTAADRFGGPRPGSVFKLGCTGLGYYQETGSSMPNIGGINAGTAAAETATTVTIQPADGGVGTAAMDALAEVAMAEAEVEEVDLTSTKEPTAKATKKEQGKVCCTSWLGAGVYTRGKECTLI